MLERINKRWKYRHSLVSAIIETEDGERVAEVQAMTNDSGYRRVAAAIVDDHNDVLFRLALDKGGDRPQGKVYDGTPFGGPRPAQGFFFKPDGECRDITLSDKGGDDAND